MFSNIRFLILIFNSKIIMREQELAELEEHVRALEQTNLDINERLNTAHVTDATAFSYYN
jgi:hypothetical protein